MESSFVLSPESPLPKWFESSGVPRSEATVTMDYWGGPSGRTATFTLRDRSGRTVARVVGRQAGREPFTVEPHGDTGPIPYASYEIITVNGVTDVVEHRKMEAIFYVATDPEVRRKIVGQVSAIQ